MADGGDDLHSDLTIDVSPFRRGLQAAGAAVREFRNTFQSQMNSANNAASNFDQQINRTRQNLKDLERIAGGIVLAQAFYGAKTAIQDAASSLVGFMNEMDRAQIALEYFLETPEQAKGFLRDMQDFAATTSFNTAQALQLSRKLMGARFAPKDVRGVMEILNDASAAVGGTPEQMDRIVLALSQIKTNGKLAGQEMRQLGEAGIPIYQLLQEELGLTGEQLLEVGKLGIKGDKAVQAVLDGLEKRYKGAAKRMAETIPGLWETIRDDSKMLGSAMFAAPYKAMQDFLKNWRDLWEKARNALHDKGAGGVLDAVIPPELHSSIRAIAGSLKSLGNSAKQLASAFMPVVQVLGSGLTVALGTVLPVFAGLARAMSSIAQYAMQAVPPLKYFVAAVVALLVMQTVAKVAFFFWNVLRLGMIASTVAKAVMQLVAAVKALSFAMARNPIIAAIMLIVSVFLYWASTTQLVTSWLDKLMDKLAALGGFDLEEQLKVEEPGDIDLGGIEGGLDSVGEAAEGMEDDVDKATGGAKDKLKEFKKFLASFDEVYQIPEQDDKDGGGKGGKGDGGPGGPPGVTPPKLPPLDKIITEKLPREIELPKLKWPEMEWPLWLRNLKELKPFDIKFNWPKFPGPPPALVTTWDMILEFFKVKIKDLQGLFDGIRFPELSPFPGVVPAFQGVWDTVLEGAGKFRTNLREQLGGIFNGLRIPDWNPIPNLGQTLNEQLEKVRGWGPSFQGAFNTVWEGLKTGTGQVGTTVSLMLQDMGNNLRNSFGQMGGWVSSFGSAISGAWGTVWTALKNAAGDAVTGTKLVWDDMVQNFNTSISAIGTWFSDMGKSLGSGLSTIWENIKGWVGDVGGAWNDLWDEMGTATTGGLLIVGSAIVAFFASSWSGLKNWGKNMGTAFSSTLAFLTGAVITFGKDIKGKWDEMWKTITTTASKMWGDMKRNWDESMKQLKNLWEGFKKATVKVAEDMWTGIKKFFTDGIGKVFNDVKDWVTSLGKKFGEMGPLIKGAIKGVPKVFSDIWDSVTKALPKVVQAIANGFKSLPGEIWNMIKSIPSKFTEVFKNIKLPSFKQIGEGIKTTWNNLTVPGYATGGIIQREHLARVGEGGKKEAIIPLENDTAMAPFANAVASRLAGTLGQGQAAPVGNTPEQILYVGTLIADDRSLRELEKRMKVIRLDQKGANRG